ncbi:DUF397 domain-containing protein [Actinomadura rupiterrae]|uniref:DUF397 domain-containing protein n=1 Tax=Actinomadura rupiterrae TaxID=559627 RepID=UPI0020A5AF6A|nr:DUF397 domain-containing protein [Actinomadura rupiterrae]MCP2341224.1 hypothetical protein [Actinomadura rupiterrae]
MTNETSRLVWRKSSRSGHEHGDCVEVAALVHSRGVAARDSKHRDGPVLALTVGEWDGLLAALKDGARDR